MCTIVLNIGYIFTNVYFTLFFPCPNALYSCTLTLYISNRLETIYIILCRVLLNPNRSLDCYALMTDLGLIWCPVNIMLKPSATLINRPLRPSGNVLASHWGVLPSRGHRSAFSASSSVQFAPNLGEESGCGLLCTNPSLVNSVFLYSCLLSEVSFLP